MTDNKNDATASNSELHKTILEQVKSVVLSNCKNIESFAEKISSINADIKDNNEIVKNFFASVNEELLGINTFFCKINDSTSQLHKIVMQSKILSLNASIEAARAGEKGRGFAVVASEVGKMAENSLEISNKISAVVRECVDKVEKTIKNISQQEEIIIKNSDATLQNTLLTTTECIADISEIEDTISNLGNGSA